MACSTPNDAWWPASLFRFSHRDRLDAGPRVRLAAASGRRIIRIGAALDGLGARCPRSYHPEPSGAKHGNRPTRRMPSRADRTGRCIFLSTALDCRSTARANGWRRSMAPDPAVVGESCMWHRMPIAALSRYRRRHRPRQCQAAPARALLLQPRSGRGGPRPRQYDLRRGDGQRLHEPCHGGRSALRRRRPFGHGGLSRQVRFSDLLISPRGLPPEQDGGSGIHDAPALWRCHA